MNNSEFVPSDWLCKHLQHFKTEGTVLDVAAGYGRNARWLAGRGLQVEAVDIDQAALDSMHSVENIKTRQADLEAGHWPYPDQAFDAIVVCRYLHRPLFPALFNSLKLGGVLVYETFMQGQEAYGKPSNPEFLLQPNELLELTLKQFNILAFEQGLLQQSPPALLQRICAIKVT